MTPPVDSTSRGGTSLAPESQLGQQGVLRRERLLPLWPHASRTDRLVHSARHQVPTATAKPREKTYPYAGADCLAALCKSATSQFWVGVAGFEPTASSSRTTSPGRLLIQAVLVHRLTRWSQGWSCWFRRAVVEITAGRARDLGVNADRLLRAVRVAPQSRPWFHAARVSH